MKHLNFRLCTLICSLLILSFNVQASTEAQELFAETLVQCSSCSCMVATTQDTTRGSALCGCCQFTEDSRALGCSCEQASVAQQCQTCRSCCTLQKRTNLLESEDMVQCSQCNCMVTKPEASTKSPALCNCHQQDAEGRAGFCACDQGATLTDCGGCASKKKANE